MSAFSASEAASAAVHEDTSESMPLKPTEEWLTWPEHGPPVAARDIPAGTLVHVEEPMACIATVMLGLLHSARCMFPEHTRFFPVGRSTGAFTMHSELALALEDRGIDEGNVRERLPIDADLEKEHNVMTSAVMLNQLVMTCPYTGSQYGIAICERISRMVHDCLPDAGFHFGKHGTAYVFTKREVKKGDALSICFTQHQNVGAMCPCRRKELARGIYDEKCACASCTATPDDCPPEQCLRKLNMKLMEDDPEYHALVFGSNDFLSLFENVDRVIQTFVSMMSMHEAQLKTFSYVISRLAIKLFMIAPGVKPSDALFTKCATLLAKMCSAFEDGPTPTLIRPCALRFVDANHLPDDVARKVPLLNTACINWVQEVSSQFPWMKSYVLDFCAMPRILSKHIYDFMKGAWDTRDISAEVVMAHATTLAASASAAAHSGNTCSTCNSPSQYLCGRCGVRKYCSRRCQQADWRQHRDSTCRPKLSEPLGNTDAKQAWDTWVWKDRAVHSATRESAEESMKLLARNASRHVDAPEVHGCRVEDLYPSTTSGGDMSTETSSKIEDVLSETVGFRKFSMPTCNNDACKSRERPKMMACTRCANVYYCSDKCARIDFRYHCSRCFGV